MCSFRLPQAKISGPHLRLVAARPTPRRHRVVVCVQIPGNTLARIFFVSKIQLRPRRAPRAFATFRLATIYLPRCLLFKWVVVKYSGLPLPVCVGCLFLRSPSRIPYRTELIPRAPKGRRTRTPVSRETPVAPRRQSQVARLARNIYFVG